MGELRLVWDDEALLMSSFVATTIKQTFFLFSLMPQLSARDVQLAIHLLYFLLYKNTEISVSLVIRLFFTTKNDCNPRLS